MKTITVTFELNVSRLPALEKFLEEATCETPQKAIETPEKPKAVETPEKPVQTSMFTVSDIRAEATKLVKAGKDEELKALFSEFGAKKISDLKPEQYIAFMKKVGELNAG